VTSVRTPANLVCPACGSSNAAIVTYLPFRTGESHVVTPLVRCRSCSSYWRAGLTPEDRIAHYETASYTDPAREELLRRRRRDFFSSLLSLGLPEPASQKSLRILDVGCSYGHLLELAVARGHECWGVEPVSSLHERLNANGIRTFADVADLPRDAEFDAIFLVDSIYCLPAPATTLKRLRELLPRDGRLTIRNANRAVLLHLLGLARMRKRITTGHIGSAEVIISDGAMKEMIRAAALDLLTVSYKERKDVRHLGRARRLMYTVLPVASRATGRSLSPGVVYVCDKA